MSRNAAPAGSTGSGGAAEERICVACGRTIEWRKKWANSWDGVRYCSDGCRRRKIRPVDRALEEAIVTLLAQRPTGSTICPSDAARLVEPDDWRPLMEPVRRAARRLVAAGHVEIIQGGQVVDPSTAKGPVRVRRT